MPGPGIVPESVSVPRSDHPLRNSVRDQLGKVKLSLEISKKLNVQLDHLANVIQGTKSDVLRRGVALFKITIEAEEKGLNLAIVDKDGIVRERIILG